MTYRLGRIAATREDWIGLFRQADPEGTLRFYPDVSYTRKEFRPLHLEEVPDLGISKTGDAISDVSYLAVPSSVEIHCREVHLYSGGTRYFVDQLTNTDSFEFRPGGVYSDHFFIVGGMDSVYNDGFCAAIARKMRGHLRRRFERQSDSWALIGPNCKERYGSYTFTADYRNPGS